MMFWKLANIINPTLFFSYETLLECSILLHLTLRNTTKEFLSIVIYLGPVA